MTKYSDIQVPEGYFQDLQQRLQAIPSEQAQQSPRGIRRLAPYFAYAASLAILALVGSFILGRTAVSNQEETIAQWSYMSYLAQSMDPDCATFEWTEDTLEEEDIVNYLVDEGLTLEEIAYYEEGY